MRFILLFAFFVLSLQNAAAITDSLQRDPEPFGGLEHLGRSFFSIDFSSEIRKKLDHQKVELIFFIDELGVPELEGVIGTEHPVIIDSFIQKTEQIPLFEAARADNQYVSSYYVLILTYPSLESLLHQAYWQRLRAFCNSKYGDFEIIDFDNSGFDFVFGPVGTTLTGSIGNYAGLGGGFSAHLSGNTSRNWLFGIEMMASFNPVKEPFPISSPNQPLNNLQLINIGLISGKWLNDTGKPGPVLFQMNATFTAINVVEKNSMDDPFFDQIRGINLGLSVHYPILLGKPTVSPNCYSPNFFFHYLNIHTGLRGLIMDNRNANGLMIEFGLSYRLSSRRVVNWELK